MLAESCCSPNLLPEAQSLDAWLLLGTGFSISLGHCTGMCGPLVGAVALAQGGKLGGGRALLPAFLVYHLGRLAAYALIGAFFGLLGGALAGAVQARTIQGALALGVGLLMALLGLGLAGWLPTARWVESGRLAGFITGRLRALLGRHDAGSRLLMGMVNGLLPCGPVYAIALGGIAAGSLWRGALAMLLFGAGTLPLLLALGLGASRLEPRLQGRFTRLAALLVLIIGLQLFLRGAAAFGWIGHLRHGEFVIF